MVDLTHPAPVRILLLGMRCGFTLPVAEALIADPGIEIAGVVVPGDRLDWAPSSFGRGDPVWSPSPPRVTTRGRPYIPLIAHQLDAVLRQKRIPLAETPSLRKRDLEPLLDKLEIGPLDAIVVACFPWKVPRWLRVLPRFGALNVHPSLLPALRGPEPEFWALRLGLRETGVTVHLMDEGLDTGPILAQRPVLPEMTLPALEQTLATVGGELARDAVHALAAGEAQPWEQVGDPTYAPTPSSYDLTVPTDLPAGWAARFVRAVAPVYAPLTVLVMATGQRLPVVDVVGFEERATLPSPVELNGEIAAVRFSPGVARFRLAPGTSCQAG